MKNPIQHLDLDSVISLPQMLFENNNGLSRELSFGILSLSRYMFNFRHEFVVNLLEEMCVFNS